MDGSDLVVVASYSFDWQAHIAKGLLEEEGIACVIDNEIFNSIYPLGFNTIGGVNVRVFRRDLPRAKAILTNSKI